MELSKCQIGKLGNGCSNQFLSNGLLQNSLNFGQ